MSRGGCSRPARFRSRATSSRVQRHQLQRNLVGGIEARIMEASIPA
eukprot:gene8386-biopygen14641